MQSPCLFGIRLKIERSDVSLRETIQGITRIDAGFLKVFPEVHGRTRGMPVGDQIRRRTGYNQIPQSDCAANLVLCARRLNRNRLETVEWQDALSPERLPEPPRLASVKTCLVKVHLRPAI